VAGERQVTVGQTMMKSNARKVRRLYQDRVLAGFAGAGADALTLFERFETKLGQVNGNLRRAAVDLAKDWRTDRLLRRLEALLAVADRESSLVVSGTGDVIEPEDGICAIGSGRNFALAQAPFIKVEASKFTEVGYVGRDVESIIRDLTELAINMVREEEKEKVRVRAREQAEERVLDLLLPPVRPERRIHAVGSESERKAATPEDSATREKLRRMLREGKLDERLVELEVTKPVSSMIEVMTPQGMEEIETNLKEMLQNLLPKKSKKTRLRVPEALETLAQEEAARLID